VRVCNILLFHDTSQFSFDIPLVKRTRFFIHAVDFLARLYRGKVDRVVQKSSHAVIVSAHTRMHTRTHARTPRIPVVIITPTVIRFESRPKRCAPVALLHSRLILHFLLHLESSWRGVHYASCDLSATQFALILIRLPIWNRLIHFIRTVIDYLEQQRCTFSRRICCGSVFFAYFLRHDLRFIWLIVETNRKSSRSFLTHVSEPVVA